MRKFHRWVAIIAGVFLLWIATTGVLSQVGDLVNNGGFKEEVKERGDKQAAAVRDFIVSPALAHEEDEAVVKEKGFTCPEDMICRPKRTPQPGEWNVGYLHHLHSGEAFGPVGVIISTLSGLSLLFFAFSGLWMYIQMFRARARNGGGRRLFW